MANEVTPIKRITITETDLTTAASTEESLDVVYVPGLFGIKAISATANVEPPTDDATFMLNDLFVNTADEKAWICTREYNSDEELDAQFAPVSYFEPIIDPADYTDATMLDPQVITSTTALMNTFGTHYAFVDDGTYGNSLDYAKGLIEEGLTVLYHCCVKFTEDSEAGYYSMSAVATDLITAMQGSGADAQAKYESSCFFAVEDTNEASVKYITTGVHCPIGIVDDTSWEMGTDAVDIFTNMLLLASTRGDAFALIDAQRGETIKENSDPTKSESLYGLLRNLSSPLPHGEYGAAFASWAEYRASNSKMVCLPGSFAYLTCYARSIRTNGSNLAIAGVTRGLVSNLLSLDIPAGERLTNAIADSWQGINDVACVNGITYIRNYGYCIWGNRTLHDNSKETGSNGLIDSSFLSIRNMLCDLKKRLRNVAMRLLFEQNNDVLWSRFLFGVTPVLERLKSTAGIANYKIIHISTDDKTKLKAVIKITTVKPLEQIEIGIVMVDDNVEVQ